MKNFFTTKRLCRAGVIAALYVALTYAFGAIAYNGFLEIRPAEALTILRSQFIMYDVPLGGLATLVASLCTYGVGRLIKNHVLRMAVGGIFPVLVNAFVIPFVIILCGGAEGFDTTVIAYWTFFGSLCATQALWVYGLGSLLYAGIYGLQKKGISVFTDKPKRTLEEPEHSEQNTQQ